MTTASRRPLRICLAPSLYPPAVGGEERHAAMLGRALARAGHHVTVVTQRHPGAARREVRERVAIERAVRPISWGPLFGPTYVATLMAFLLRHRGAFDLVQATYLYWDAVATALVKKRVGARLVVRVVIAGPGGDLDRFRSMRLVPMIARWDRPILERLTALTLRRADAVIVLNGYARQELLALGVAPTRCHVVPNGVEFPAAGLRPRASAGERHLLCVARLAWQKGLDVLLRALPTVCSLAGPVRLTLVGDGAERGSLEALARTLGIGSVRFVGTVEDVSPFLAAADVFVLPSRYEGLPLALLEAMAFGLPVVATAIAGNADIVRDGVDGLLVPPEEPAALAAAIVRVLEDPSLAARLGAGARQAVQERYSIAGMLQRTLDVYGETIRCGA